MEDDILKIPDVNQIWLEPPASFLHPLVKLQETRRGFSVERMTGNIRTVTQVSSLSKRAVQHYLDAGMSDANRSGNIADRADEYADRRAAQALRKYRLAHPHLDRQFKRKQNR